MHKKIIISILTVLILLSSCSNKINNKITETESNNHQTVYAEKSVLLKNDIVQEDITNNDITKPEKITDNFLAEPPYASYFTLEQLKDFKNACESMSEDDFNKYLDNSSHLWGSSIYNRETAMLVLKATENTTIALLDGDISNFYQIHYHDQRHYITQPIIMTETKNLVCSYYTDLSEENIKTHHENTEYITYITDVTNDGVTASVYLYPNGDVDELYAEIFVDGTRITYRVTEEQTIEEFEADFARLEFVKIGDLLNE